MPKISISMEDNEEIHASLLTNPHLFILLPQLSSYCGFCPNKRKSEAFSQKLLPDGCSKF
jgi:hypothetical protein